MTKVYSARKLESLTERLYRNRKHLDNTQRTALDNLLANQQYQLNQPTLGSINKMKTNSGVYSARYSVCDQKAPTLNQSGLEKAIEIAPNVLYGRTRGILGYLAGKAKAAYQSVSNTISGYFQQRKERKQQRSTVSTKPHRLRALDYVTAWSQTFPLQRQRVGLCLATMALFGSLALPSLATGVGGVVEGLTRSRHLDFTQNCNPTIATCLSEPQPGYKQSLTSSSESSYGAPLPKLTPLIQRTNSPDLIGDAIAEATAEKK